MKLLNKTGLPEVIVNAIHKLAFPPNPDATRISVTSLISPPIIFQLKRRHWDEMEEEATDSTWRLMGSAIHKVIESVSEGETSEVKVEKPFGDITISGQADVVQGSELYDYKITSSWSSVFSEKRIPDDWYRQMNVYAYLIGGVKTAKIIALFRDWSRRNAEKDPDYPSHSLMAFDVPLASELEQLNYIQERIKLHKEAMELPDEQLPICSPEERWKTETTYAVYKNENKTATRVFNNREEADRFMSQYIKGKDNYRVEVREGKDKKCLEYCPVSKWCAYGKTLKKE